MKDINEIDYCENPDHESKLVPNVNFLFFQVIILLKWFSLSLSTPRRRNKFDYIIIHFYLGLKEDGTTHTPYSFQDPTFPLLKP